MFVGVVPGNVTRLPCWAAVSNVDCAGYPNAACKNLTTYFVLGDSYTPIAFLLPSIPDLDF